MTTASNGAEESPRRLILGLGNPGERYRNTRHNVGFEVVEELARRRSVQLSRLECNTLLAEVGDLTLGVPQTYMNRSGYAARCLVERHGVEPENVLVVFDEVNLPLARLRLRTQGSPGGHRGMESIIQSLNTDRVPRLRLGIGPEEGGEADDLVEFVLEPFDKDEREQVAEMIERAADACESWLEHGSQQTMNRYNS
jgi:PTH1 family peptidyl-tRNA hydrolase